MKRPLEIESTVAAPSAMVGALRTKMLTMLVPSRILFVERAHAVKIANASPPCPSAIHAESNPLRSANLVHPTTSFAVIPPQKLIPTFDVSTPRVLTRFIFCVLGGETHC